MVAIEIEAEVDTTRPGSLRTAVPRSPVQGYLDQLHRQFAELSTGEVATYIPELGKTDPMLFSVCVVTVDGYVYVTGDSAEEFSIQSISKPFVYGMALQDRGVQEVLTRVGVEPTGDPFNSITVDETSNRPFNPMVNAGAIVTTSLVDGASRDEQWARITSTFAAYTGRSLDLDLDVFASEQETGDRNRAIAYLMKNFGMLDGDVDAVLDLYFRQCSLRVTCRDLAVAAATLANGGVNPITGVRALPDGNVEHVLSVMQTCGMYDFAGGWTYDVGLPAKSGVSGGVIAVLPGQLGIGVFSPPLDPRGNSVRGVEVCRRFAHDFALHPHRARTSAAAVVRRSYTGHTARSTRVRSIEECDALARHGDDLIVYELQGPLYFADAEALVRRVLDAPDAASSIVLDGRRVTRVDTPAVRLIAGLAATVAETGRLFALAGFRTQVEGAAALEEVAVTFPDIDDALESWEERILAADDFDTALVGLPLDRQELLAGLDENQLDAIAAAVTVLDIPPGTVIAREGDPSDAVYLLLAGQISVRIGVEGGTTTRRLAAFGPGVAVGEMALIDRAPRSADIVVDVPSRIASLPVAAIDDLERDHPGLAATLYANLAQSLSFRLRRANDQIRSMEQ